MQSDPIKMTLTIVGALLLLVLVACAPAEPGAEPGAAPTEAPTDIPTEVPTDIPTEVPTEEPTEMPTEEPTSPTPAEEQPAAELTGSTWSLVHWIVGGDAAVPPPAGADVFFEIEEGRIAGNSGCNRFSGPVTIEDNSMSVGMLISTKMACAEELMSMETAILDILSQTATYAMTDEGLELQNADGLPLALFTAGEPQAQAPIKTAPEEGTLTGRVWQWQRFESSDGSVLEVEDSNSYTLEFLEDGTYLIQADCNGGSGSYTAEGSSITLEPGPMTLVGCGEESLDGQFLSQLGDVVTYVFDEDGNLVLNLMMDAGNMVFAPAGE